MSTYDFCGWATKNDIQCEDGLIITKNAFMHQDGETVPLVWQHNHDDPKYVIGSALLKNADNGVRAYCSFNNNQMALDAKESVYHGDITRLSICAKVKKHDANRITQGKIKEVSLVISGANPGAVIEEVAQSEDGETTYIIDWDEPGFTVVEHSDDEKTTASEKETKEVEHSDDETEKKEAPKKTIKEILETLNDEQAAAVGVTIAAIQSELSGDKEKEETKEDKVMHGDNYNVFDRQTNGESEGFVITHSDEVAIIEKAKECGKFSAAMQSYLSEKQIEHADGTITTGDGTATFGWNQGGLTLDEYHPLPLQTIDHKDTGWIGRVERGVTRSPFAKVKMNFANISEADARARGYVKGNYKYPQVFNLSQRSISPTNIIAKQQANQEDLDEIEDFDAVNMIKQTMNKKLKEEQARAILFGDGRDVTSPDKIKETNVIPAYNDDTLFTIKKTLNPAQNESDAHAFIQLSVRAQDEYQGSGSRITAFVKSSLVTDMLLMEDGEGRRLYKSISEVAMAMGVDEVIRVPSVFLPTKLLGLILDLGDYSIGYSRLGKQKTYESFDIDYNVHKYLTEVRMSGALTVPYSAIAISEQ